MNHTGLLHVIAVALLLSVQAPVFAADPVPAQSAHELIKDVIYNELQDRQKETYWQYHIEKRVGTSTFSALQVETREGPISRMTARNGQPLTADQKRLEDERLEKLMRDPAEQARVKRHHEDDEQRLERLMKLMPDAFLYEYDGASGELERLKFRPNPDFVPATYEARVFHALVGTILINPQQKRLAHLQGTLVDGVDFGYGLFGHVEKGGTFALSRQPVSSSHWKTSLVSVHVNGHIILFKTISKDQDEVRTDFKPVPSETGLKQAMELLDQPLKAS